MTPLVRAILYSPMSRAATYTPPEGGKGVPCRVVLNDTPGETRREAGEEFMFDGAEAVVSDKIPVDYEGIFEVDGSEFTVRAIHPSRAPGLNEIGLTRISGPGIELFDLSSQIISGAIVETVILDGRSIEAVVARRADTLEVDDEGYEVVVQRNRVAIRRTDLQGDGVRSMIELDGESLRVTAVRRTSAGILTLIC